MSSLLFVLTYIPRMRIATLPTGRLCRALSLAMLVVVALAPPRTSLAQRADSATAGVRPTADSTGRAAVRLTQAPRDSLAAPVSPGKAFLLSLALPGLGQSKLNRPTAGAVYFVAEAVWLAMLAKAANDLRVAKAFAGDVVVNSYAVDAATGRPLIVNGKYVVKDTLRSRYAEPPSSATDAAQQRSRVKARRLHFEDWIAMLAFNHLFSAADAFVSSQLWDLPTQVEVRATPHGAGVGLSFPIR
ncbi:MAG: hypothetical protein ABIZ91_14965 [Gemmatimonadaceae bacterium]